MSDEEDLLSTEALASDAGSSDDTPNAGSSDQQSSRVQESQNTNAGSSDQQSSRVQGSWHTNAGSSDDTPNAGNSDQQSSRGQEFKSTTNAGSSDDIPSSQIAMSNGDVLNTEDLERVQESSSNSTNSDSSSDTPSSQSAYDSTFRTGMTTPSSQSAHDSILRNGMTNSRDTETSRLTLNDDDNDNMSTMTNLSDNDDVPTATTVSTATVTISKIPHRLTQPDLLKEVQQTGFGDAFNFLFLPYSKGKNLNAGYGLISFLSLQMAKCFVESWHNSLRFTKYRKATKNRYVTVELAEQSLQGLDACLAQVDRIKSIDEVLFEPIIILDRTYRHYLNGQGARQTQAVEQTKALVRCCDDRSRASSSDAGISGSSIIRGHWEEALLSIRYGGHAKEKFSTPQFQHDVRNISTPQFPASLIVEKPIEVESVAVSSTSLKFALAELHVSQELGYVLVNLYNGGEGEDHPLPNRHSLALVFQLEKSIAPNFCAELGLAGCVVTGISSIGYWPGYKPSIGPTAIMTLLAESIIYEGIDPFGWPCAIKAPRSYSPESIATLKHEAWVLLHVGQHPNIVSFRAALIQDPRSIPFAMAFDWCSSDLLRRVSKGGPLPEDQCMSILYDLLEAIAHLDTCNVVHRNVKPDNVLLTRENVGVLCDFGISETMTSPIESATKRIGTPGFMAPEIFLGRRYDSRADVFSVGAVGLFMLFSESPFAGRNVSNSQALTLRMDVARLLERRVPGCSQILENYLLKMLEGNPQERPRAGALLVPLLEVLQELSIEKTPVSGRLRLSDMAYGYRSTGKGSRVRPA